MTPNWPVRRLEDVTVKIGSGATPRGGKDTYLTEGIALIRSQNVYNDGFSEDGLAFISSDQATQLSNVETLSNDILLNITGDSTARTCMVPNRVLPARVNQHVAIIRTKPSELAPGYLRYWLILPETQANLLQWASAGATRNALTKGMIERLEVPLPPLPEQRAIAHILGTLDDKIELNRQMNQTLDDIARTLFRSWFVDFDPVRAKAEGRRPHGMNAETAALFPDRLVDSPLGPIPEGWEWRPLDQIASFLNGLALQKYPPKSDGSDLPVIKIAQLRANSTSGAALANRDVPSQYQIEDGDFLFSWSGSLLANIWSGGKGALNQHLFKVTSDYPQWFIYQWVQEHLAHFRGVAADKATTMGHINRHHLSSAMCALPSDHRLMQAADNAIYPTAALGLNNALESQTLAKLRDTLLPELLSGRLPTPSAAELAEVAI